MATAHQIIKQIEIEISDLCGETSGSPLTNREVDRIVNAVFGVYEEAELRLALEQCSRAGYKNEQRIIQYLLADMAEQRTNENWEN